MTSHTAHYRIKKRYYRIETVARYFKAKKSAVRFWIQKFGVRVGRGSKNYKMMFTREDISRLKKRLAEFRNGM